MSSDESKQTDTLSAEVTRLVNMVERGEAENAELKSQNDLLTSEISLLKEHPRRLVETISRPLTTTTADLATNLKLVQDNNRRLLIENYGLKENIAKYTAYVAGHTRELVWATEEITRLHGLLAAKAVGTDAVEDKGEPGV